MLARLSLLFIVLLVALLAAEGALSLGSDQSFRELWSRPATATLPRPLTAAERRSEPAAPYSVHEDPRVGYTLRPESDLSILKGRITTDEVGMRVRPGPPPGPDDLSLVVLGDSVAFGFGVNDDETLAAQLEVVLASLRANEAPRVVCHTVATPSWNHRNALHFLFDHWDRYSPDVVVYVPVNNDLSVTNDVYATGRLRLAPDPMEVNPWLMVSHSQLVSLEAKLTAKAEERGFEVGDRAGPLALVADLSPESQRRYDENASSIAALHQRLAQKGAKLLVVQSGQGAYAWHLTERLAERVPDLPVLFLERRMLKAFTLGINPHPNSETLRVRAIWVAEELLTRGWVGTGNGEGLPPIPAAYAKARAPVYDVDVLRRKSEAARAAARAALRDTVEPSTGLGIRQILAGVNMDRSIKNRALVLLAASGPNVVVQLAPIKNRQDLYPCAVDIFAAGEAVGSMLVDAHGFAQRSFPLPKGVLPGDPVEVLLAPRNWCVVKDGGRSQIASVVLLRVSCPAP